jgi:hypothetical protein
LESGSSLTTAAPEPEDLTTLRSKIATELEELRQGIDAHVHSTERQRSQFNATVILPEVLRPECLKGFDGRLSSLGSERDPYESAKALLEAIQEKKTEVDVLVEKWKWSQSAAQGRKRW